MELNEEVSRKLGWIYDPNAYFGTPEYKMPGWRRKEGLLGVKDLPDYTGSISDAWEIINNFHEVTVGTILKEKYFWFCEIRIQEGNVVKEYADTAPMAICNAFLKIK